MNQMKTYKLGDLLPYEQPTKYIVNSTEYADENPIPVLTAGKSFILGYTNESDNVFDDLPVIIFDDFTTATQYVDFQFKVKSSAMKILHINQDLVLPKFIFYKLQTISIDHSTHKRYWIQHYSKIKITIPTIPEQEQIVKQIEESLSQLDSAVATLNKTKQQLDIYRQAVLKEAFSGKLTYKSKDGCNQDWSIVSITKLIKREKNSLKAGPFGSALKKSCYVPCGYKVYGQEQVIAGDETIGNYYVNDKKYEELFNCRVRPRDVLISLVGTVGKVLILSPSCKKGIINPRLIKVSLDESVYLPEFFKYYFESAYLKSLYKLKTHGATMDVLNMGMIKELPFPLCSTEEQAHVIQAIETRFSLIDKNERTINQSLQQAEALRQSILKQAFPT